MGFLSSENKADIEKIFEQLSGDVQLRFFTKHDSPLFIPGQQECTTCKDTQTLLEEVTALSEKLKLEVHDVTSNSEIAREYGIERLPALIMTADGVKGKVRYFGMPSGYEFSVLLGSLVDVSRAEAELSEKALQVLTDLQKD